MMHATDPSSITAAWRFPAFRAILFFGLLVTPLTVLGSVYRIGPRDLLDVVVTEVPQVSSEVRVSGTGSIFLPLLGEVEVEGLTPEEVAERLKKQLEERYVYKATVVVRVKEFTSRPITVMGAVKTPGPLVGFRRMTLIEALSSAGGVEEANTGVVHVIRRSEKGLSDTIEIDLEDLLMRGQTDLNIPVFSGDIINVPAPVKVSLLVVGEVGHPGTIGFLSTERMTLLVAIARAGGLTDRASPNLVIRRTGDDGRVREIEVNYKKVLAGRTPDVELQANDVIYVKKSFF